MMVLAGFQFLSLVTAEYYLKIQFKLHIFIAVV